MVSCNAAFKVTMLSMGSLELLLRASVFTVLDLNEMGGTTLPMGCSTTLPREVLGASLSSLAFSIHSVSKHIVLHIISGCQRTIILGIITQRHNVACKLIMKAISTGSLAVCLVHLVARSTKPSRNFEFLSMLIIGY